MSVVASDSHTSAAPPPWVMRWTTGLPAGVSVLDVACDSGRHVRWLVARGLRPTGINRNAAALLGLANIVETIVADIEGSPWSLPAGAIFDVVIATNYLYRLLQPHLLAVVASGGRLIYGTFADGNEATGRPSNSAFLLTPGELLDVVRDPTQVIDYENGFLASSRDAYSQQICVVREPSGVAMPRCTL